MFKKFLIIVFAGLIGLSFTSCSKTDSGDFQVNEKGADFSLFHLFDGYRSLEQAWNSIDGRIGNEKLADLLNSDRQASAAFLRIMGQLMDSDPVFLDDVVETLRVLTDKNNRYYAPSGIDAFYSQSPDTYQNSFYGLFDNISSDIGGDHALAHSVLDMSYKVINDILNTKTNGEILTTMSDLVNSVSGVTKENMMDIAETLSKTMIQADYPMWLDSSGNVITDYDSMSSGDNSGLGNSAKGIHSLLTALVRMTGTDALDRDKLYDLIDDMKGAISSENITVLKKLICNLEDYFTIDGAVYSAESVYNTNNSTLYSDAELKNTVKDLLAGQVPLLLREDRPGALISDTTSKQYVLGRVVDSLDRIYINFDKAQIKDSIYDLLRFDTFGRDRETDANAYPQSILESFLFLGGFSTNFGWEHGGGTNEINGNDWYDKVANAHGHGQYDGRVTLNDSLFSMRQQRDSLSSLDTYSLAFGDSGRVNHIFRSRKSFSSSERNNYKFYYDQNYGALQLTSGACVGDTGVPEGGNPDGGEGASIDQYRPYNGNGAAVQNLASFTMGWVVRACWEGEGPYYYADPDAETVEYDGKTWKKYLRPNGKIYAYVRDADGGGKEYFYPQDGDDPLDPDGTGQRDNRYKATWHSDYYMIHAKYYYWKDLLHPWYGEDRYYTPTDMSGHATSAGAVTYNELVPENDPARACASQEEAIFRNYQWVTTEKKFVMIVPMWLHGTALGCIDQESVVFQIIEGNGFTGLTSCRKFRGNRVWAKANTTGSSSIPGDYRLVVNVQKIPQSNPLAIQLIDESKVYDSTLGRGTATPAIVGHNFYAMARFAFPRSEKVTGATYEHYQLGSRDFAVGDANWKKRNALIPLLMSFFGTLHEHSTVDNNVLLKGLEGLNPLTMPLVYFNHNISSPVCDNGWIPRIAGTSSKATKPHAAFLLPDSMVSGFTSNTSDKTAWRGGWAAVNYYQPAHYPTLVSFLIDSDSGINRADQSKRCDGLLAKMTEYDVNANGGRPAADETPAVVTASEWDDPTGIDYTLNSDVFDNTTYSRWGVKRRLFYAIEEISTGMKMTRGVGTTINENNSIGTNPVKDLIPPKWLFEKRDVDLDLDAVLDTVIGPNADSTGLAYLPDTEPAPTERWSDIEDPLDDARTMIDKYLTRTGSCSISDYLFDVADAVITKHQITDDQISGVLYTLGKFLAYYNPDPDGLPLTDDGTWLYQGDDHFNSLYNILKKALPQIHGVVNDGTGNNYAALLANLKVVLKEDGLARFVVDTSTIAPYSSRDFFEDLYDWTNSDLVSGPNTVFWSTMGSLLYDLANVVASAPDATQLNLIYQQYGFQQANW